MKKVGITGQKGFVGSYLYNTISLYKDEFTLVPFEKEYFEDVAALTNWVGQCDVIVHLAAMNRHPDAAVIHDTNIDLVEKLVAALEASGKASHVLFSSSTQEEKENEYGRSKSHGRQLLAEWAAKHNAVFTGLVIPNVYGPFGKPFYNSVVATFCHLLCNGGEPKVDVDGQLKLIYVGELVEVILGAIRHNTNTAHLAVAHTVEQKVTEILAKLNIYKSQYQEQGIFPAIESKYDLNLFNTFRSYINHKEYFPFMLKQHADNRGVFVELVKLHQGGQVSYSTTHGGITRGNHFHTRKIERFLVIKGKALIQLRKYNTDEVLDFYLDGEHPSYVDMPIWYTHNIKNIGKEELYTVFWINEFFNPEDPDTWMETV
jgi:UDP-2-acetamido-2,6-beta-L-arabino-hexul-4-ose reductase